jgi:osmoprotectant transport system permease protein
MQQQFSGDRVGIACRGVPQGLRSRIDGVRSGVMRALHRLALAATVFLLLGLAASYALATSAPQMPTGAGDPTQQVKDAGTLRIGSKRFTESYILAQLLAQRAAPALVNAPEVRQGLGNTAIVYEALRSGAIDLYPEYTGTIAREILKRPDAAGDIPALNAALAPLGLGVAIPLGFQDGYGLAMRSKTAASEHVAALADLTAHPALRFGLSNEFLGRADGWPGLAQRYQLPQQPRALDHGLAYSALAGGQVDVIDIYTTDAKIAELNLAVLKDTDGYFPRYDAVVLYRLDVPQRFPHAWAALQQLRGKINEPAMIAMNAQAEQKGADFADIAHDFLDHDAHGARKSQAEASVSTTASAPTQTGTSDSAPARSFWSKLFGPDLGRLTRQHLLLVVFSVALAALIAVPLAFWVQHRPRWRGVALGAAGLMQTVPSLALLAVLISLTGVIGTLPALIALTLYAVLPILRNTATALAEVPPGLRMAAMALGLRPSQQRRFVELPLALPVILAGVRTATSISIGTATIAAFIGAGGYGERIVTGLALNDRGLLLAGAVPAAALALLSEAFFVLLQRAWVRR